MATERLAGLLLNGNRITMYYMGKKRHESQQDLFKPTRKLATAEATQKHLFTED